MTEIKPEKGETESYLITDGTLVSVGALVEQGQYL
jgi:hypothetical protein